MELGPAQEQSNSELERNESLRLHGQISFGSRGMYACIEGTKRTAPLPARRGPALATIGLRDDCDTIGGAATQRCCRLAPAAEMDAFALLLGRSWPEA